MTAATATRTSRVRLQHGAGYCYGGLARNCKPRDRLTVSQWSDRNRWLTSKQSGEPGRWQTKRNPLLQEIMDCLSVHSPVHEIVVMKSSQVGVTEATVNVIGYTMDHAPAPLMVLMPTLESRDKWKVQKLNPLITDTQVIRDLLGGMRSRDAANRADIIDFPGGILFLSGGNSPNSYAQNSARIVVMDDLDRFPEEVGAEGDPVSLGRGRTKAFRRSKLLLISTPTVKDASLIEREYENSDRRRYHLPCPACGEYQHLKWSNLRWDAAVTEVWYQCENSECGHEIREHHKPAMLAKGRWIAEDPSNPRRGYHISALTAPIGLGPSWLELAQEWKTAHTDQATLKTFLNTNLGETWADTTSQLKPHELAKRAEDVPQGTIPVGCLAITIGVDTQDKYLAINVLGIGPHHYWVLEYHELQGDTTLSTTWDMLEQQFVNREWKNAFGMTIRPRGVGIDSRGHRSEEVRQFVARRTLQVPVYSLQGSTSRMGRPIAMNPSHPDKNRKGKVVRDGYGVWNVGTEHCKDWIFGRLASDAEFDHEGRMIRFPAGLDDDYWYGLLSEVKDPTKNRYVKKRGAKHKRNEPLDTFVYAWAICHHKNIMLGKTRTGRIDPNYWHRLEKILEPDGSAVYVPSDAKQTEQKQQQQPDKKPRTGRRIRATF